MLNLPPCTFKTNIHYNIPAFQMAGCTLTALCGTIDQGRNPRHVAQMAIWKAITFDILHPRVPDEGQLQGELTHRDKVYKESLPKGAVPAGGSVFLRDSCRTCEANIEERKVMLNHETRCWCEDHDRNNDQGPRMHPPPYIWHGVCKVCSAVKEFFTNNAEKSIPVEECLIPHFLSDVRGNGLEWCQADLVPDNKFCRGCIATPGVHIPPAKWMVPLRGFIVTGRPLGASSGAEGLPTMVKPPPVAKGVWAVPSPQETAAVLSRTTGANLAAPAAVRVAAVLPPPPPLTALRERGPPLFQGCLTCKLKLIVRLLRQLSALVLSLVSARSSGLPTLLLRRKVNILVLLGELCTFLRREVLFPSKVLREFPSKPLDYFMIWLSKIAIRGKHSPDMKVGLHCPLIQWQLQPWFCQMLSKCHRHQQKQDLNRNFALKVFIMLTRLFQQLRLLVLMLIKLLPGNIKQKRRQCRSQSRSLEDHHHNQLSDRLLSCNTTMKCSICSLMEQRKKRRKEVYDVDDGTGLINLRKRRAQNDEAEYDQLSRLRWKAPKLQPVETVVAPIVLNGHVPECFSGLLFTDDLKASVPAVKTHPIESQTSQSLKKAETRRFAGGKAYNNLVPPKDKYGNTKPWTGNQGNTLKILEGLTLYVGDATGGIIAISDSTAANTDFSLDGANERGVGGSTAAAQGGDDESADEADAEPIVRQWLLDMNPYKNNDGNLLSDIGPATSVELMEFFKLCSADFPHGCETHQINRYGSNNQLIPFHVIELRKSLSKFTVPNVQHNWYDWNTELNKLAGTCWIEVSNLKLEGPTKCTACAVDDNFITSALDLLHRDWIPPHEEEGLLARYWNCNAAQTEWQDRYLDHTNRRIYGAYLRINEMCHWIIKLLRHWGNLNDTEPPWRKGLRCSKHGLFSVKEIAGRAPTRFMNRSCKRVDIMNCIYYDLHTRRDLEWQMGWPFQEAKQRIQCFRMMVKHPKAIPQGHDDYISREWVDTTSYSRGHSTACWRYQKSNYEPTEEGTEIRPRISDSC